MIDRIRGIILDKSAGKVVVEVGGGIGLSIQTPLTTFLRLPEAPAEITLLARLIIREENWELFGFLTRLEKESFNILTSVSRVGPRLALTIISALEPGELARILLDQDLGRLSAIKGIGAKTAERLLVELKDKATKLATLAEAETDSGTASWVRGRDPVKEEATQALMNLGFTKLEADRAVKVALGQSDSPPDLNVVLKESLNFLSSSVPTRK